MRKRKPKRKVGPVERQFIYAPSCPNGRHELEETVGPYFRICVYCNERFALVSETVLRAAGIQPIERSVTKQ